MHLLLPENDKVIRRSRRNKKAVPKWRSSEVLRKEKTKARGNQVKTPVDLVTVKAKLVIQHQTKVLQVLQAYDDEETASREEIQETYFKIGAAEKEEEGEETKG